MYFRKVEKDTFPRLGTAAFLVGRTGPRFVHLLGSTGGTLQITESTHLGNFTMSPTTLAG